MPYKDPDKQKQYVQEWEKRNKKQRRLQQNANERARRVKDLEKTRAHDRAKYANNPKYRERKLAYNKKYQKENAEKLKAYKKQWAKDNLEKQRIKRQELKDQLIEKKGGRCEICGWAGHQSAFDFHHIDPLDREWNNGRGGEWVLKKYRGDEALDKVQLLCANCHRILHHT